MSKVPVHVTYCGGWGYGSRFRRFQTELEDELGDDVAVTGESTPTITGYFEVKVGDQLVHSKNKGDGFVDSKAKLDKVIAAVKARLG